MDAFVTPGIWFVLAATFKLFGASVLTSRIPVVIAYLLLIAVSHRITWLVAGRGWGFVTTAILMACTVWAFPAWTFAFYSPFAVLFGLGGLERLLSWRSTQVRRDLIVAGLLFGISILFKQNYGAFALVGGCLALGILHLERGLVFRSASVAAIRDASWLAIGVAAVAAPVILYFASQGILAEAFQSLVVHPFEFSGKHDIAYAGLANAFRNDFMRDHVELMTYAAQPVYRTPMPDGWVGDARVIERLHVLMYWIPPLIFILGLTLGFAPPGSGSDEERETKDAASHPIDGGLLSVVAVALLLFLGVFPRADFNHLINVYQPVVIAGVVGWAALSRSRTRPKGFGYRVVASCLVLMLGAYFAVAGYWYRGLLVNLDRPVAGPRGGVLVSPLEAGSIRFVLNNIDSLSEPGEALLSVPDIAMLNFLSARPMPSPYYNLYEHHIAHDGGAEVVAGAEKMDVQVAVTRMNNFFSDRVGLRDYGPVLTRYLDTHFKPVYTVGAGDYVLYARRPQPMAEEVFQSILDDCEWYEHEGDVGDHLLYRAAYHMLGLGTQMADRTVETKCRARVPEDGGELVWRFDYRKPMRLYSPTTLRVDVLARTSAIERTLFSDTYAVETIDPRVYRFPAPRELRADLSEFAGQDVDLILRSTRSGRLVMPPGSRRGFGTNWIHPRIVFGTAQSN